MTILAYQVVIVLLLMFIIILARQLKDGK